MSKSDEVITVLDEETSRYPHTVFMEDGVVVPYERIEGDTLRNLIIEFVTREWEEIGDKSANLEEKIVQVMRQLKEKKAKVVYDLRSETCNIIIADYGAR